MSGFSSGSAGLGSTFNTNQSLVSDTKRLIDSAEEAAFTFIVVAVSNQKKRAGAAVERARHDVT